MTGKSGHAVTLRFTGGGGKAAADRFMIWLLDGGGEDVLLEQLEFGGLVSDGIERFDLEARELEIPVEVPRDQRDEEGSSPKP